MGTVLSKLTRSDDDNAWQNVDRRQLIAGDRTMEIVAILLLTVAMVSIGWAANDRGEVRTVGSDETIRRMDS